MTHSYFLFFIFWASLVFGQQSVNLQANKSEFPSFEITSEAEFEVNPGEVVYLSGIVSNQSADAFEGELVINHPERWQCTPASPVTVALGPNESKIFIFGIKVELLALAGKYTISN